MSKVIRIDDETFVRLQNLAEPFIDTPSSVVERLLNYYESSETNIDDSRQYKSTSDQKENRMAQNLFLAPASEENIRRTIKQSISLTSFENLLTDKEREIIRTKTDDPDRLHCWAMTESSRPKYSEMKEGDIVLFSIKDSGKFQYSGKVETKIENEELGSHLWDFVPTKPWKLIYFLKDIRKININKSRLVVALGYERNYVVPGVTKINRVARDTILAKHGSVDAFIDSFSA